MLYIYGFFVLCYFPCSVVAIAAFMTKGLILLLDDISLTVTFCNSALNPVLFCWRIKEMRQSVRQIIKKWKGSASIDTLASQVDV